MSGESTTTSPSKYQPVDEVFADILSKMDQVIAFCGDCVRAHEQIGDDDTADVYRVAHANILDSMTAIRRHEQR